MRIITPEQVTRFRDVGGGTYETLQQAQVANAKHALYELCGGSSSKQLDSGDIVDLIMINIDDFIEVLAAIRS